MFGVTFGIFLMVEMMKDFEPPPQRRDSAASIKLQSQLSNLTYRVSKSRSGTTAIPADPHFDVTLDVHIDGIPPSQVQLKITKNSRADELLRHVLHQLSSTGYQRKSVECYTLSEVVRFFHSAFPPTVFRYFFGHSIDRLIDW